MKSDLRKLYLYSALFGFVLYYSFDKILMETRGLTVTDIVLVEIVYSLTVLILEVPSGALADRWSRKKMLAWNVIFFMLNTFVWIIAQDIGLFILGVMFGAVHTALKSGTFNAFIYDTLKESNKTSLFEKVLGSVHLYASIATASGAILGSMIADWYGITIPFWITLIASSLALIVVLTMKEPTYHKSTNEVSYWQHIIATFKYLWKHPSLYHIIALTVALLMTLNFIDEYAQLYFLRIGVPLFFLGYLASGAGWLEGLAAKFAYYLRQWQRRYVYLIMMLLTCSGLIAMSLIQNVWGIIFVFIPFISLVISRTMLTSDLHNALDSSQRATGESFVSLLKMIVFIPIALGFSYIADHTSLFWGYGILGIVMTVYVIVYLSTSFRKI